MEEPKTLSFREVAAYLRVSLSRVYQLEAEGRLPEPIRLDASRRGWPEDEIKRWADREWWGKHSWRQPEG